MAERDELMFWKARALEADSSWVGVSSTAMLRKAVYGLDGPPAAYPYDKGDLARCEETYRRAPACLKPKLLPTLEMFRRMVDPDTGKVDLLWCYACDHGGHRVTYGDFCEEHRR